MKLGIVLVTFSCLYTASCTTTCTTSLILQCKADLEHAKSEGVTTASRACHILDRYITCVTPCGNKPELQNIAYDSIRKFGVECGSAVVTTNASVLLTLLPAICVFFS